MNKVLNLQIFLQNFRTKYHNSYCNNGKNDKFSRVKYLFGFPIKTSVVGFYEAKFVFAYNPLGVVKSIPTVLAFTFHIKVSLFLRL